MTKTKRLIAMTGQKRSGKDTVAGFIKDKHDFEAIAFAGPLKGMIRFLLQSAGMSDEKIVYYMEGDGKEVGIPELQGKSARFAMQKLGTEWRNFFGADLWSDIIGLKVDSSDTDTILTDMRFPHEGDFADARDGTKVRVRRAGQSLSADAHPSETEMEKIVVDATILNFGSLAELQLATDIFAYALLNNLDLATVARDWKN